MNSNGFFEIKVVGHVGHLIMNRPENRNCMGEDFFADLPKAVETLKVNKQVRVIILRAKGKVFCAGFDLNEIKNILKNSATSNRRALSKSIENMQKSLNSLHLCPKPVIATVGGACIGGGVDLLCYCDIRLASKEAFFSVRETRMAMVPDLGTIPLFSNIVGRAWAQELIFTGEDFSAEKAFKVGFVTHVAESQEELINSGEKIADKIAANSPLAIQESKEIINYSQKYGTKAGLKMVAQKNGTLLFSDDVKEAYLAFLEKRNPEFKGT